MEDIIRMDMDFLENDNLWEPFMKKENKNLLALKIERDNHKAEVDEMKNEVDEMKNEVDEMKNEVDELEKKVAMAEEAREEAEAMLARERKARVEFEAKVFALENDFKDMKSKYDKLAALLEKYMIKQPSLN